ncbi:MAG: VOC family protein [Bdellovibrio sp.]|nr:VOC family protein [Bdellovibrio sp.]
MKPFTLCLWFDTQAEEAAHFYTSIFKDGKIGDKTYFGKEGFEFHGKPEGTVLTVEFEANGQKFVALNGGPDFKFNEAISLTITCETQNEIDEYWEKLTAGGGKGVQCGWLRDKFGLAWQVTPEILYKIQKSPNSPNKSRALNEMFQQVKLDIGKLQKAFEG